MVIRNGLAEVVIAEDDKVAVAANKNYNNEWIHRHLLLPIAISVVSITALVAEGGEGGLFRLRLVALGLHHQNTMVVAVLGKNKKGLKPNK